MSWNEIVGHERQVERFRRAAQRGRLAGTYLFVGRNGIGKKTFALKLAQSLLCERYEESLLNPCGACRACQQVNAMSHPDLLFVNKPKDKNEIPSRLLVGEDDTRGKEGLCRDIQLKPFCGGKKVAIIDDADDLNATGANCLLKTLEEPPPNSILILISTNSLLHLPTLVSRSQIVRFDPLSIEQVESILARMEFERGEISIAEIAAYSHGSVQTALEFAEPSCFRMRQRLIGQLSTRAPAENGFSAELQKFIEGVSTDAARRRQMATALADDGIEFFATVMRSAIEFEPRLNYAPSRSTGAPLLELSRRTIENARTDRISLARMIGNAIHRTQRFQDQISANANLGNILPSWLIDLGKIFRNEYVAT
jgi:DNA polymerase-3 subunit delta'